MAQWQPPQSLATWLSGMEPDSSFSMANLPLGIFSTSADPSPRAGIALGIWVVDLRELARDANLVRLLPDLPSRAAEPHRSPGSSDPAPGIDSRLAAERDLGPEIHPQSTPTSSQQASLSARWHGVFDGPSLNSLAVLGRPVHQQLRLFVQNLFSEATPLPWLLRDNDPLRKKVLVRREKAVMHLPMQIGDYTDFYAGLHHATAVGTLFRGRAAALQPNYTHLPVAYAGRSSSVVVSGTSIRRPRGQIQVPATSASDSTATSKPSSIDARPGDDSGHRQLSPQHSTTPAVSAASASSSRPITVPTRCLDFELELGCFISRPTRLGDSVSVSDADAYIFGYVLVNDWSARDLQRWEYVPLGPFNSKNFATSISPWVVLPDALEPFRVPSLPNPSQPLQYYLCEARQRNVFDLNLEVNLTRSDGLTTPLCRVSSRHLLWSFPQMIAHHTLSGCPLRAGDLLATGTISGPVGPSGGDCGSLLEATQGGLHDLSPAWNRPVRFLSDGDTVNMRGWGNADGLCVGFGRCTGVILPALS